MKNNSHKLIYLVGSVLLGIFVLILLVLGTFLPFSKSVVPVAAPKVALFICDAGRTISATFYPNDDRFVNLTLNDGRALSVPRAISASGARYANADESFVFWNKGDTAFIVENSTTTYANCFIQAP